MTRTHHFISGLPRSGSTLLSAILRQNPRFHADMSSPVAPLFQGFISQVSAGTELSSMVSRRQRADILRGLFDSFYRAQQRPVVFDTNRRWTACLPPLVRLFPRVRIVCMVRNVAWIMDSLERQFRQNEFEDTQLFHNASERATVYSRVEALGQADRLVGLPWHALREACYSEFADHLLLVDYDILVQQPERVLHLIYEFLEERVFEHDLTAVQFDCPEFDSQLGLDGLHRVHPQVAPRSRATILPPDLFERYCQLSFWHELNDTGVFRIVPAGGTPPSSANHDDRHVA
ncbi:MAG: sulfotransferase [Planctomycetaceae bacterium]|nr:sulfotransferase [Planctomycetaceae bacterium]